MLTKKRVHAAVLILSSLSFMVLYQQCAPAKFSPYLAVSNKVDGSGTPSENPDGNPSTDGEIPNPDVDGPVIPDDPETIARGECLESLKSASIKTMVPGDSINDNEGDLIVQATQLRMVTGNKGKLVIWGLGENAMIGHIAGNSGKIILCGISVGRLTGNPGELSLTSGHISVARGSHGSIKVTDGSINDLNGISGIVEIDNGEVAGVAQ